MNFRDKVVLITGGSSGIGQATALRLGKYGARIALAARNRSALDNVTRSLVEIGGEALAVPTDVTQSEQCRNAIEAAVQRFGRLDILICSAGVSMRTYFARSDLSAMERVMAVNFMGTLYCTYYAIPHVRQTKGSLVALSSLTGLRGIPSYGVYGASKFAIQGLYESLRLELGPDGIHVGVVAPGFVDTPLRNQVIGPDGKPWKQPPAPPFRIWPVEKCVDRIVRLLAKRRAQANLPGYLTPFFWLDRLTGNSVGDAILRRAFPPV
jgi:NAD(P)-dependent dehydrogenase (short-subunit alcohol dehydrogenase family)